MPYPRASHSSVAINNIIYVFGGHSSNPSNVLSSVIAFDATLTSINDDLKDVVPDRNKLYQNYPNPFNGNTTIEFGLNQGSVINLSVYDIQGKLITELSNDNFPPGLHKVIWDGKNDSNKKVSSGTYLVIMNSENQIQKRKILYLK